MHMDNYHKIDMHTCSAHKCNAICGSPSANLFDPALADSASESCSIANSPLLTSISLLLSQASLTFLRKHRRKQSLEVAQRQALFFFRKPSYKQTIWIALTTSRQRERSYFQTEREVISSPKYSLEPWSSVLVIWGKVSSAHQGFQIW